MKFIFALILFLTPLTVSAQNPLTTIPSNRQLSCERIEQGDQCSAMSYWVSIDKSVSVKVKTYYILINEKLVHVQVYFPTETFDKVLYLAKEQFGEPSPMVSPLIGQQLKIWSNKDVVIYLQDQAYEFDGFGLLKIDIK